MLGNFLNIIPRLSTLRHRDFPHRKHLPRLKAKISPPLSGIIRTCKIIPPLSSIAERLLRFPLVDVYYGLLLSMEISLSAVMSTLYYFNLLVSNLAIVHYNGY